MAGHREQGATLPEMMVSLVILALVMTGLAGMMIQNVRINTREQLHAEVQANARNCVSRIVTVLRSAGWDPGQHGILTVALDPDTSDSVSQIEAFIDRDGDGLTSTAQEQILIRHVGNRVEWRTDGSGTFRVLAWNITNDADGDSVIEPMFTPDSTTDPRLILVQVTAEASQPDPETGDPIRYTMTSEVALRKEL
jgi:prepilin-type N-terminal cleavage/methylation domain-containing protein